MTKRGTQVTGLGIMIGRSSPESQHGRLDWNLANAGFSLFRYTNDNLNNYTNQNTNAEIGLQKITNLHFTVILRANTI